MAIVLVAYASKYGATKEIAEAVAKGLQDEGVDAEVRSADDVADVTGYTAAVLGGALYYFRLHRDARHFLKHHRKELQGLPVAVFADGPTNDVAEEFEGAREQLDKALAKFDWLSPVSVTVFGGELQPEKLRFPDNNPAMKNMPANDVRDWDAIAEWARSLPKDFGFVSAVPG